MSLTTTRTFVGLVALAFLVASATGFSQSVLWEKQASNLYVVYGSVVYSLPDVNGDGVQDVLLSVFNEWNGPIPNAGYVAVLSGSDGSVVHETYGTAPNAGLQVGGTVGDVDGDGAGDYLLTSAWSLVRLVSGATGTLITKLPWTGTNGVCGLGDVNGDGFGDFAMGSAGGGPNSPVPGAGIVVVYAGPTGRELYHTYGTVSNDAFGARIAPIGDLNGDGVPDFLVGAPGAPFEWLNVLGWGYACSGADGSHIHMWTGPAPNSKFGMPANIGDQDGDGVDDILLGAPGVSSVTAHLFSGRTGLPLTVLQGAPELGGRYALLSKGLGDLDGDGISEFAVGGALTVFIHSGGSFGLLHELTSPLATWPTGYYFGASFDAVGDVNGDDVPDLIVGLPPLSCLSPPGRIQMHSLSPQGVSTFGAGCPTDPGIIPRIGARYQPRLGEPFTLNVSRVGPGQCAALILGNSNSSYAGFPLPMAVEPSGLPGCELLVSMDALAYLHTWGVRPGEGTAGLTFQIPAVASLSGITLYAQWAVETPGGHPKVALSRGLEITLQ